MGQYSDTGCVTGWILPEVLPKDCPKCNNGKKIGTKHSEQNCGFCGRKLTILR